MPDALIAAVTISADGKLITGVMLFAFTFAFTFAAASYTYTEGTAPILKVDNRTDAYIGELVKINISLTEAPGGVSGYNISVAPVSYTHLTLPTTPYV